MILRNKCLLLLLCCTNAFISRAQQFKYAAALEEVPASGFYAIGLLPGLSAYTKADFSDVRIVDKNDQWIPHLLKSGEEPTVKTSLAQLPLIQNQLTDSGKNLLIIENKAAAPLNNLVLTIKNTLVSRTGLLSGSNNQQDWFIIDDQLSFNRSNETGKEDYLQPILFPPVTYRYFKIIINNDRNDPLLVNAAGYYASSQDSGSPGFYQNPATIITQRDSNTISIVHVHQVACYPFQKISLEVNGPAYYKRVAALHLEAAGKEGTIGEQYARFDMASNKPLAFTIPLTKTASFYLLIYNGDNPPLRIRQVTTHQEKVSILTYLEKGKTYRLVFGDSLALPANYDLAAFKDSIQAVQSLGYKEIYTQENKTDIKSDDNQQNWIWPAIVVAAMLMGFLVYRLSRELPAKNN